EIKKNKKEFVFFAFFLIALLLMVTLGGVTRLTGSGLSIVEWAPLSGVIPPFSTQDWQILFDEYKKFPEFCQKNSHFTLSEFKGIFWLEYLHRFVGRLLGLFLLIPTLLTWKNIFLRRICLSLWILGGLQGLMGWWMVKSGLVSDPWVSPLRLTAHLLLALLIFSFGFVALLKVREMSLSLQKKPLLLWVSGGLILLTILWGGLVAGNKAGLMYNTFPLMEGQFFPQEAFFLKPVVRNFFENPCLIQWIHRMLALSLLAILLMAKLRYPFCTPLFWGGVLQVLLGILTLLGGVPLGTATLHQLMAFILWGLWLWAWANCDYMRADKKAEERLLK
ncbi:MAG: COX15/CtaA family protein, partial [Holosporales bacterium]